MKSTIPQKSKAPCTSIEDLYKKTQDWVAEIEFIKIEQQFLKELLAEHIIELCESDNFNKAKLLLKGIDHESILGDDLLISIDDHNVNLSLLLENIYLKREANFRNNHELIEVEVTNYIQNFRFIKEQIYELVLLIMKNNKKHHMLSN
ncbi:hypothetical protein MKD41_04145 [Lutibacter sp. A64]|uniref:hypothetical protein n=1 Tax=Lutibacter sp. A64 TaxID=2918526 RepID=UPI001F057F6D|nr:hypothetical protein [Lutibacter sp. A64]UMB54664.1 hypothetical protein MKD41_04145 [Lutibacter sp. A64]